METDFETYTNLFLKNGHITKAYERSAAHSSNVAPASLAADPVLAAGFRRVVELLY